MSPASLHVAFVATAWMLAVAAGGALRGLAAPEEPLPFQSVPGVQAMRGRVIVRLKTSEALELEGKTHAERKAIREKAQGEVMGRRVRRRESKLDMFVVDTEGEEENSFIEKLKSTSAGRNGFEYVEPDFYVTHTSCPDDPLLASQWHHDDSHLRSCAAWSIHTGTPNVTIAICDSGLDTTHPDLQRNRKEGYNAVDQKWESAGGNISAVHAHGTWTAGCAASNGNNSLGVSGIGWNLSYRPIRVTNSADGGAYISDLIHAATTAADAGDKVVSVSFSGANTMSARAAATYVKSKGGLLVWAAGNDGANLRWGDRDSDDLIVVGATDSADRLASFSAYGKAVDVVAPGVDVYTTDLGGSYAAVSGTSFATPLTAGLVGLIWSSGPGLSPGDVERVLKQSCDDLGVAGRDNKFGYGRINALKALQSVAAVSSTTQAPTTAAASTTTGAGATEIPTTTGALTTTSRSSSPTTTRACSAIGVRAQCLSSVACEWVFGHCRSAGCLGSRSTCSSNSVCCSGRCKNNHRCQ